MKLLAWLKTLGKGRNHRTSEDVRKGPKHNPYVPQIREILQQILVKKGLNYGTMRLLIIDTDQEPESLLDEDDVELAMKQLSGDLNFLEILTQRPAYFTEYVERMYEEAGLLVHIEEKGARRKFFSNTVLDFEKEGELFGMELEEPAIYIPIYKKNWETMENLDISVPIGYNTVIVKGIG